MSGLAGTVEGNDTKSGRFSNFAFTSDNGILQKNSTLRNWFLRPTVDNKGEHGDKGEKSTKNSNSIDTTSQSFSEEKKLGRKVRSFFKQTISNKDGSVSEDEEDASFWKKSSNKCTENKENFINGEGQNGSFTKKIRNSIFKGPIDGNEKEHAYGKNLLLPVELSSDDENESRFTDANSHAPHSVSPEKYSPRDQISTKCANNKGQNKGCEDNFKEDSDGTDEDEFSPATPPQNVLEGPYKFVFQTPNTFTSQSHFSEGNGFHKGGRYVIEYLSKRLSTLNIDFDFDLGGDAHTCSEKELHQISEKIIESIADEILRAKLHKEDGKSELEELRMENSKLLKLKHQNSIQKQEIISLKTKLESLNKKNNDVMTEIKILKNKITNEKIKESSPTDENENGGVTKSSGDLGVLELNVNETSQKSQQTVTKPSKYLPRETRNNEVRLKYLEKKIFGLEKSLEKKKKQTKTDDVRIDLNKYTIEQFLNLLKSLNAVLQFHNVYGNDLKEYSDNIVKIETYCSALNTKYCLEEPSLRLQGNSFKRQLGPLFTNVNFSLIEQITMNFRFYERSVNFQKETIGGLRMMMEEKDHYIKTLMQHLKKKEGTKLIKGCQSSDPIS